MSYAPETSTGVRQWKITSHGSLELALLSMLTNDNCKISGEQIRETNIYQRTGPLPISCSNWLAAQFLLAKRPHVLDHWPA